MANKQRLKKNLGFDPELDMAAGEPCGPGSIEQQLDMCEKRGLRGDEVSHLHGMVKDRPEDLERFRIDMSEDNREGDEMSGDEHSAGMQGGEPELASQPHIDSGIPGDRERRHESIERSDLIDLESEEKVVPIISEKKQKAKEGK